MAMEAKTAASSLMWFRKGLRIHDNPALVHAAAPSTTHLYPVFVLDPVYLRPDPTLSPPGSSKSALPRIRFLLASLADLDASLRRLGSRLLLLHPSPRDRSVADVVVRVCRDWGVRRLCYEFDAEPYYRAMDRSINDFAVEAGVEVFSPVSHSLFDPRDVIRKNGGRPPLTYQSFIKLVGNPSPPLAHTFSSLPPLGDLADHTVLDSIPTLEELGYTDTCQEDSSHFPGGESEALRRLDSALSDVNWVANFEKPKGDPSAFLKPATTLLSPYLKFGCLSSRYFYQRIDDVYENVKKHTSPPVSLVGQLLWRDFFYTVAHGTPNFDQMKGNKICKQIPWNDDDKLLAAWRDGRTGFPWIDAIMIQLHKWGWMHHLARHCVACFLTRGDLFIHWEKGRDVFERLLVDSDWAINNGNWMWLSCSAFFHQYNRIYSPITFGKKYDPSGSYIRHFLPVLKDMPKEYIYEPWTAPLSVQKKANCIIGKDYPNPVVSHETASKECKRRMGEAYALKRSDVSQENEQKLPSVHKKSKIKLDVSPIKKRTKQKKVV